jgi:CheY-like chemotaxis protein/HPt (histidine-containing phosphotransfer) domain-containing protein
VLMGKRILIVDDNPTNRRILTLQTQTWGMEPVEAATPHEALDILRQDQPFDLALLDMHMPEMDGASLAAAMCAEHEQQGHHFPLVLLTSLGYETHPELEAVQCFSAYLTKPVKPSQLYDVLVSVLVDEEREARRAQSLEPITETNLSRLSEKLPLRILLAEDVVVNQKFALLALDEMGYTADVAANGLEALEALKRQPYDVILMDVQMPEMDGLTATRQIRDCFSADRQPRIIAMTANAMQGDRELCLEAGMDDYISKPVYLEELQAALERAGQWLKTKRREKMTSTPDLTEIPILDQAAFDKILKYAMSNDLISAYIEEANALVGSLQQAVARADAPTIRARAHALKGSSSYIGAQRVRALSHEMEQAGKTGLLTHTPDLLAQLLDAHQQTRKALMR